MKKRKRKSFLSHYNTYFEKIYRYIFFRVGKDQQLAEDLTSEIMLKAYEHFEDYDEERKFSVWIYRIAHNHLVDYYKKVKAKQVPLDDVENILHKEHNLDTMVDTAIETEKVEEVLDQLPDQQREIMVLKFMNDLSNKEIADILSMTEAHVRVLQHRALGFLRTRLSYLQT